MKHKKKRGILIVLALLLAAILIFAGVQLLTALRHYSQEADARNELLPYRPERPGSMSSDDETKAPDVPATEEAPSMEPEPAETTEPVFVNESIVRLKADHPNALGWLSVPGTQVDYPFVQGPDNDYFLHRDVDGNELYAGIPFLDYRCPKDLSGVNTVIYAHNMRNGSMFGELDNFRVKSFFDENRDIFIYLEHQTIHAEIVACLVVDPAKKDYLYAVQPKADHLEQIYADARCLKRVEPSPEQRFVTLSTCGFEFSGSRILIVGIVTE